MKDDHYKREYFKWASEAVQRAFEVSWEGLRRSWEGPGWSVWVVVGIFGLL